MCLPLGTAQKRDEKEQKQSSRDEPALGTFTSSQGEDRVPFLESKSVLKRPLRLGWG